jgi:hypothetical protein
VAEHEPSIGQCDDWYTPPEIFDALGLTFDLDPCSPGPSHWVPARQVFTKQENGLAQPWSGLVFMSPPFGGRNGHVPWLRKFLDHGDGVAIVRAYTSSAWFHRYAVHADPMLFPKGKTKFIRPDGSVGRAYCLVSARWRTTLCAIAVWVSWSVPAIRINVRAR